MAGSLPAAAAPDLREQTGHASGEKGLPGLVAWRLGTPMAAEGRGNCCLACQRVLKEAFLPQVALTPGQV